MDAAISKANKKYEYVLSDKEALHQAMLRERAIIGYNSNIADAEARGEKRGEKIGEARAEEKARLEKIEMIKNMLSFNIPVPQIAQSSNLTEKEIRDIKEKYNL